MKPAYSIKKPEDFQGVIEDVLSFLQKQGTDHLVIALKGDLGAGKTTFTQQLAQTLGVDEVVTSPTFTIMKQYSAHRHNFSKLIHIDAYRIEDESEVGPLGLVELFNKKGVVVCIEWPEKISSIIPVGAITLNITIKEDEQRMVELTHNN